MLSEPAFTDIVDSCRATASPNFVVLFPAYEPDETLIELVDEVLKSGQHTDGFCGVLIVDDGSRKPTAKAVFDVLKEYPSVSVLVHEENRGKGGALKTGFRAIYQIQPSVDYVVTADADGQHTPTDIFRLAEHAMRSGRPNIGYRTFSEDIPFRSRFGNILTAAIFRIATGVKIHDTQSGLRTFRRDDLPLLCEISADRYEYEFHCLFHLVRNSKHNLDQIPIETIYEPGNPTSHFNPILDSFRIYAVFIRYVSVSVISGSIDFLLFSVLAFFQLPTLTALILSRCVSAPIYFFGMRNVVFKSLGNVFLQGAGTIALMALHIVFLWRFIEWVERRLGVHPIAAMLAGLLVFYVGTFIVQRFVIYRFGRRDVPVSIATKRGE